MIRLDGVAEAIRCTHPTRRRHLVAAYRHYVCRGSNSTGETGKEIAVKYGVHYSELVNLLEASRWYLASSPEESDMIDALVEVTLHEVGDA